MAKIFISYRHGDPDLDQDQTKVILLFTYLANRYGEENVFKDHNIDAGTNFEKKIINQIEESDIFLILIGKTWIFEKENPEINRLSRKGDWVRREVETAIKQNVKVFPILVDNTKLPQPELLPKSLKPILSAQAHTIRFNSTKDFSNDMSGLVTAIDKILAPTPPPPPIIQDTIPDTKPRRWIPIALLTLACVSLLGIFFAIKPWEPNPTTPELTPLDNTEASYPGGADSISAFLLRRNGGLKITNASLTKPGSFDENWVTVTFHIDSTGNPTQIETKGAHTKAEKIPGIINSMTGWVPEKKDGQAIVSKKEMTLYVHLEPEHSLPPKVPASYPGGESSILQYFESHQTAKFRIKNVQSKQPDNWSTASNFVKLNFKISKEGTPEIYENGSNTTYSKEAERILLSMNNWNSATKNTVKVTSEDKDLYVTFIPPCPISEISTPFKATKLTSVPLLIAGDPDFYYAVKFNTTVRLSISTDKKRILASLQVRAEEWKLEWTNATAPGNRTQAYRREADIVVYTANEGQKIQKILTPSSETISDYILTLKSPKIENGTGLVSSYTYYGDHDGNDVGSYSKVVVMLNAMRLQVITVDADCYPAN